MSFFFTLSYFLLCSSPSGSEASHQWMTTKGVKFALKTSCRKYGLETTGLHILLPITSPNRSFKTLRAIWRSGLWHNVLFSLPKGKTAILPIYFWSTLMPSNLKSFIYQRDRRERTEEEHNTNKFQKASLNKEHAHPKVQTKWPLFTSCHRFETKWTSVSDGLLWCTFAVLLRPLLTTESKKNSPHHLKNAEWSKQAVGVCHLSACSCERAQRQTEK